MGLSLGHLIVILIIVAVIWGPSRFGNVGKSIGEAVRGFKKGLHGDDEIDITSTSRRLPADTSHQQTSNSTAQLRDVGSNIVDDALSQAAREKSKAERS